MPSRHELTTSTYRPEKAELEAARPHVPAGKTFDGMLRALLRAVAAEPDKVLPLLLPHWPEEKRRGRPRKTPEPPSE